MNTLILQAWRDSNMAGDEWVWSIVANQRADKSWSIGAHQIDLLTGKSHRLKGVYRLRSGLQFKEAIERMFRHEELSEIDIDWEVVVNAIKKVDKPLGAAIAQAIADDQEGYDSEPSDEANLYGAAYSLVARSQWPRSKSRGGGGVGYAMENAQLSRPIVTYALAYHAKHNVFPVGSHKVGDVEVVFAASDED